MDWLKIYTTLWLSFHLLCVGIFMGRLEEEYKFVFLSIALVFPMVGRVFGWW